MRSSHQGQRLPLEEPSPESLGNHLVDLSDRAPCASLPQVWNPRSGACTATVETGYGLSLLWAPGDRHAVVGTKVQTVLPSAPQCVGGYQRPNVASWKARF